MLVQTAGFPPLSGEQKLLRQLLSRKLVGSAQGFQLRVIDSRARIKSPRGVETPGVFERPVVPPEWFFIPEH
jgi:hypothetical protein